MEPELNELEEKINQFVHLYQQLQSENNQLRQQLTVAVSENKHLAEKINDAAYRLEALLTYIPKSLE